MKLNRMLATFGKLDNDTLELGSGLNIITAPNEGGKSTWTSFLKSMLYGIDSRERDKKGYIADKNHYQPWSGKPMVGQIDLTWGDRDITLRRAPKGGTPFGAFTATYTGTDSPVGGLTATDCGFVLTGVEREVFERSAFLGTASHAITAAPELERRIAALVTTGEEEFSYSQVENQLKEWSRFRRLNKSVGRIPKLEGELAQVEATLSQLTELNGHIAAATGEQVTLKHHLAQLERELEQHRQWENHRINQKFTAAKLDLDTAQRQLDGLTQQTDRYGNLPSQQDLRHWQGELAVLKSLQKERKEGEAPLQSAQSALEEAKLAGQDDRFGGLLVEDAQGLCQRELANYEKTKAEIGKRKHRPLMYTALMLLAAGGLVWATVYFDLPSYVPGGCGGILGSVWMTALIANRTKKKNLIAQNSALLARYQIETIEELSPLVEDYVLRQQNIQEAESLHRTLQLQQRQLTERENSLHTRILDFVHGFSPDVQGLIGCSAAISRGLQLDEQLAVANANLAGAQRLFTAVAEEGGALLEGGEIAQPTRPINETAALHSKTADRLRQVEDILAQLLGRQQASGDPVALAAQREQIQQELNRRNSEYAAIQTALAAMQNANIRLQERFSPQLNAKASEYLTYLTEGKYSGVSLNRELEGSVTQVGDLLPHSALILSQGTNHQLYFALRLAVCSLCLPADETVPLVLDDALAAFDQARMERALDLLCQLAKERQIVLFSCHQRERDYLQNRENVTCISL